MTSRCHHGRLRFKQSPSQRLSNSESPMTTPSGHMAPCLTSPSPRILSLHRMFLVNGQASGIVDALPPAQTFDAATAAAVPNIKLVFATASTANGTATTFSCSIILAQGRICSLLRATAGIFVPVCGHSRPNLDAEHVQNMYRHASPPPPPLAPPPQTSLFRASMGVPWGFQLCQTCTQGWPGQTRRS